MQSFKKHFYIFLENKENSIALLKKSFPSDTSIQKELFSLDQTPSKGDIPTIIKLYNSSNNNLSLLTSYLKKYYVFKKNNIPVKLSTNFISFTEHIDAIDYKQSLKNKPANVSSIQIEEGDDENKIAEDNDLIIYKAHTQRACIKYGKGYSFCISRMAGGNMYNNYRLEKESTFYFIFFKKIPKNNVKHIMVLDHKKDGWEYTFADNATEETTWEEIITQFPILEKYESLFVNVKRTASEEEKIKKIQSFNKKQSLETFKSFDLETKLTVLTSGTTIIDQIYDTLNLDLKNEYVSQGPNLTDAQVEDIDKNNSLRKRYIQRRNISFEQLHSSGEYEFNKLDIDVNLISEKIKEGNVIAEERIKNYKDGNLDLKGLFLIKLPDMSGMHITGNFNCGNNNLASLAGSPSSVGGHFDCYHNNLTTLEGSPSSVGGNFDCSYNNLITLEGAPSSVGGNFDCSDNNLITLEGAPSSVGGGFVCSNNNLTTLEGAPRIVGRGFYCSNNNLTTLEGAPMRIGGNFSYPSKFSQKDAEDAKNNRKIAYYKSNYGRR